MIRRDINRLSRIMLRHQDTQPVLAAVAPHIHRSADRLNQAWNHYQHTMSEAEAGSYPDAALNTLLGWIHRWRPAVMLLMPEASAQLGHFTPGNGTPREVIRLAENIRKIIDSKGNGLNAALDDFGFGLAMLCQESPRYNPVSPCEMLAREHYIKATLEAHASLIHGVEILRAVF